MRELCELEVGGLLFSLIKTEGISSDELNFIKSHRG